MSIGQEGPITTRPRANIGAMSRPSALTPVPLARERLLAGLSPLPAVRVPLAEAHGAVLAADLAPSQPIPAGNVARLRGFAVSSAEVVGASSYSPAYLASSPALVEAGDPLPVGMDAVVPLDAVQVRPGSAEIMASAAPGEGVRRLGEDAVAGAPLATKGTILGPIDLALAASLGLREVEIRHARLALVGSSDHPVAVFAMGAGRAAGAHIVPSGGGCADFPDADIVVFIAPGALPFAAEALDWGLALRPGEETGFGVVNGRPVIVLPGQLDAALAAWVLLVRPCLDRLQEAAPLRPGRAAPLTRKISSTVGLTELALVRTVSGALEPVAVADLTLAALSQADGWLAIPPELEGYPAGAAVEAYAI